MGGFFSTELKDKQDAMVNLELFQKKLNDAAAARKLKLIWQTEASGPHGNGNGMWDNNMGIRRCKTVNGVASHELLTSAEIVDEMQRKTGITQNSLWLFAVYLRGEILYFTTLPTPCADFGINPEEKQTNTPFDDQQFIADLQTVAKNAGVNLTIVNETPADGWQYNVSVYGRFAANVFAQMMIPLDKTHNVEAMLPTEETAQLNDPGFKLLYYNFNM